MALDLGELSIVFSADDTDLTRKLDKAGDGVKGLFDEVKKFEKTTLDVTPTGADEVDKAKRSAEQLGREIERTGDKAGKVKMPTQPREETAKWREEIRKTGDDLGGKLGKWASGGIKWAGITAGTAAIGGLGTALTKGFGRLNSIDQATAKLEALGNSGQDVENIMDNALASVKGTAFGIGEAAGTAATMVASGVEPGKELESVLTGVADSAAIAGVGMDEMGLIWGKVAAKGKLDGETMAQMLERQIPIYDILSEKTGVASEDIADMVSEGKISFETFADAMNDYVGGGAVRMGETFSGAVDNMWAAAGRLGEAFLAPAFGSAPEAIGKITDGIDGLTEKVKPAAKEWANSLQPHLAEFGRNIGPQVNAAMSTLGDTLGVVGPLIGELASAMGNVPFPVYAGGIMALIANHKGWNDTLEAGGGVLKTFAGKIGDMAAGELSLGTAAMDGLKGAGEGLLGFFGGPWGLAIGVAAGAVTLLWQEHQKAKVAEEEHKRAQEQLRDTLDETTGAITDQTNELVKSQMQESGALDVARDLGLAHSLVADAALGNKSAQQEVQAAIELSGQKALASSDNWNKFKDDFAAVGFTAEDVWAAINGDSEKMGEINRAVGPDGTGFIKDMRAIQKEIEGTTDGLDTLSDAVFGTSKDLEDLQAQELENKLNSLARQSDATAGALELVGDSIISIPDEKTIHLSSLAPEVAKDLEELGIEIERMPNGEVKLTFPDGVAVTEMIRGIGGEMQLLENGQVRLEDNTPEVKARLEELGMTFVDPITGEVMLKDNFAEILSKEVELEAAVVDPKTGNVYVNDNIGEVLASLDALGIEASMIPSGHVRITDDTPQTRSALSSLGIETTSLPGGHVAITDTTPENMAALADLGITTQNLPPGWVQIDDTSDTNISRLNSLGIKTTTLPDGSVVIKDNANETAGKIRSVLDPAKINTFSDHTINIVRKITDIFTRENAHGNIYAPDVKAFADGGVDRAVNRRRRTAHEPSHDAHIAPAGSYRVFAESETGGEAYIPLADNKRSRSARILNQVADRFGYRLQDKDSGEVQTFANGGISGSVKSKLRFMDGTPYVFGGWSPAGVDCSGAVALVDNARRGVDLWGGGRFATGNQASELANRGWIRGRGHNGDFRTGFYNGGPGGGHTSVQLPDGTHVESGGNTGGGFTIGGKAGPLSGRNYTDWFFYPGSPAVGDAGLNYLDGLEGATPRVGGDSRIIGSGTTTQYTDSGSGTTTTERELNGGNGTLIKDGSFLELIAAIHSKQTGTQYDDDVVSWGQAIGLYSKVKEESQEKTAKEVEKKLESLDKSRDSLADKKLDLQEAKEDLRIKKMQRDETYKKRDKDGKLTATSVQKASADQTVSKAERKVQELEQEIKDLEAEVAELSVYEDLPDPAAPSTSGNRYADAIIREGKRRGISNRGIKIALATALVESDLKMYANPVDPESMKYPHDAVGSDHDSVGLFQQRNNGAWGTTADRMDPERSAGMFYDKLDDADYNTGDPGAHAQRVQASAFPGRYNERMSEAEQLLTRYNGKITPMANGGILGGLRQAHINDGSSAVLWAEAGPEAYIPLSSDKKAQSLEIWAETGKRLGVDVLSLLNLIGSTIPNLMQGRLEMSTGATTSMSGLGLNLDAASYRGQKQVQNAVGAVFNGPVQINDPKKYLQNQYDSAAKQLGTALRSVML